MISIETVYVSNDDWFIGGESLAALGRSAFNLDIRFTDETNTKAEEARYRREVFAAMATLRPDLHELSQVHLIDARAAAYGCGGATQAFRISAPVSEPATTRRAAQSNVKV